jgi:hypothetical protein
MQQSGWQFFRVSIFRSVMGIGRPRIAMETVARLAALR